MKKHFSAQPSTLILILQLLNSIIKQLLTIYSSLHYAKEIFLKTLHRICIVQCCLLNPHFCIIFHFSHRKKCQQFFSWIPYCFLAFFMAENHCGQNIFLLFCFGVKFGNPTLFVPKTSYKIILDTFHYFRTTYLNRSTRFWSIRYILQNLNQI